ncbi:hypothetical protein LCGC14_2711510, partial [marine sediment metagenome]
LWINDATGTSAEFAGQSGDTYAFYSIARDNAGQIETAPLLPDAQTVVNLDHTVAGRYIFYNNSIFDGHESLPNDGDDSAIATNKTALTVGAPGPATFANYTSYDKGINGIIVDIFDLPAVPTVTDFVFRVGNNNSPNDWPLAPAPSSVTAQGGDGVNGSDRVTVIWPDNAIENQWLQVTVLANERTGLLEPDTFYFGNTPGEAGNDAINTIVNATDEIAARNFQHSAVDRALIDDPYDYNRDGLVDGTDQIIARENQTNPLTMLRLITTPLQDAAIEQATALEPFSPKMSSADLDWLCEFEQMTTKRARPKRSSVEEAVDMLIATESL